MTKVVNGAGEALYESAEASTIWSAVTDAIVSGTNLSGADLSRADLSRANLSGAYLYGADLSGADLFGANLSGAYLYGAYLSRANLYGADLSGAYLFGANLSRANLSGADLYGAYLSRANLYGADLSGAYLYGTVLQPDLPTNKHGDFTEVDGECVGFRTRKSIYHDSTVYQDGKEYTAEWFSVCPLTAYHPGLYVCPAVEDVQNNFPTEEVIEVRFNRNDLHAAGGKYRVRRFKVVGTSSTLRKWR